MALSELLGKRLYDIGVEADLCEATSDKDAAGILIWEYGQDYSIDEADYHPDADSFLELSIERPGAIPGGTGDDAPDISPPTTGDGGLK